MSNQLAEIETPSVPAEIEEPVSESTAIIQVIERAALNPAIDVEKMERLLSLQERILDREAEQSFNVAMKAAQEEMPQVLRDAKNASTSSRYARLETIAKAINPVVTKHGFSMSFGTDDSPLENHYRVTCKVSHVDGHSRDYHADVPADLTGMKGNQNKTATHGFGSTMSYGRRYLTLLIFNVALINEDDDGNAAASGKTITDAQFEQLHDLLDAIEASDADIGRFCKWLGVASLEDLPAKDFGRAKSALEQKKDGEG